MANPFDDDVDVSTFYKPQNKKTVPNSQSDDFNFYEQQIEQILQSTVDSSGRSVLLFGGVGANWNRNCSGIQLFCGKINKLIDSNEVGKVDLVVQGEKLHKVSRQLDEINSTTKQSQKHLNNIKSLFGGIKNFFAKSSSVEKSPTAIADGNKGPNKLSNTVNQLNDQATIDFSVAGKTGSNSLPESSKTALSGTRWEVMNNQVEENLDFHNVDLCHYSALSETHYLIDLMSANLRRLRNLGAALGQEIDDQNAILDSITVKADKADTEIRHQDRQMKKILGGGKTKLKNDEEVMPPSVFGNKLKK